MLTAKMCLADDHDDETTVIATENAQAKNLFQCGFEDWEKAWTAEENFFILEATENFKKARESFSKAVQLNPKTFEYQKYFNLSCLKIEGNESFNEAVKLQNQANETSLKYLFQESRNKFEEACKKYQQGYSASGNSKFIECKAFIEQSISTINMAIKKLQLNTGLADINFSDKDRGFD